MNQEDRYVDLRGREVSLAAIGRLTSAFCSIP